MAPIILDFLAHHARAMPHRLAASEFAGAMAAAPVRDRLREEVR